MRFDFDLKLARLGHMPPDVFEVLGQVCPAAIRSRMRRHIVHAQGVDILRVHNVAAHSAAYRGWAHLA